MSDSEADAAASSAASSAAASSSAAGPLGAGDTLTLLVATDLHLGFAERDPVRGLDSFLAFEEVLATARSRGADAVLLAGDIFHENKPSRMTMFKTIQARGCLARGARAATLARQPRRGFCTAAPPTLPCPPARPPWPQILRRYVLGYSPVRVQVLSDQAAHWGDRKQGGRALFNRVNWEDPHFNVVRGGVARARARARVLLRRAATPAPSPRRSLPFRTCRCSASTATTTTPCASLLARARSCCLRWTFWRRRT